MAGIEIRRLKSSDAEAAIAALDALLPTAWRVDALPSTERMRHILSDERIVLMAAYADGAAAGYVSGYVYLAIHRDGVTVMLDDLFVAAAYRGLGLGCKLVDAFRAAACRKRDRPVSMWAGTDVDNAACRSAFAASGGEPSEETYKEYTWRDI